MPLGLRAVALPGSLGPHLRDEIAHLLARLGDDTLDPVGDEQRASDERLRDRTHRRSGRGPHRRHDECGTEPDEYTAGPSADRVFEKRHDVPPVGVPLSAETVGLIARLSFATSPPPEE